MAGEDPEVAKQIKAFDYGKISAEEIIPLMRLILPDFVSESGERINNKKCAKFFSLKA
jgi:hypothetical protein